MTDDKDLPAGTRVVLVTPYAMYSTQGRSRVDRDNQYPWLVQGATGTILPGGIDPDGDYRIDYDRVDDPERWFYTHHTCLEILDPLPAVLTPATIDEWLEAQ